MSLVQPRMFTTNEEQWIEQIQQSLNPKPEEGTETRVELEGIEALNPVTIFGVPKTLMLSHPDSYTPQEVSIGPYHHLRVELYDMEWYKVAAAKRKQKEHQNFKMQDVVEDLIKNDLHIRASYHRPLNNGRKALAWMMAVDASFLLELFEVRCRKIGKVPSSLAQLIKKSDNITALNAFLRDIVMLENQIPLFVIQKLLKFQYRSAEFADQELLDMLMELSQDLSPFLMVQRPKQIKVEKCEHLLDFLYKFIVPSEEKPCHEIIDLYDDQENSCEQKEDSQDHKNSDSFSDPSHLWQLLNKVWKIISNLKTGPAQGLKKIISSKPLNFASRSWTNISKMQGIKIVKGPIVNLLGMLQKDKEKKEDPESPNNDNSNAHPSRNEIAIPSVSQLLEVGVRFEPVKEGITSINFELKTQTFYIPVIDLDANSEIVLRNLIAYEAGGIPGELVLTRYTELMNGIIDTEVDAKFLCQKGIIANHLKSEKEVADLWNGMSKSIRLTKVPTLDKVIENVNKFYDERWKVKFERFMKEYVFGSWRFLTFLATVALLLLMTLQAFCQVYSCSRIFPIEALEPLTQE